MEDQLSGDLNKASSGLKTFGDNMTKIGAGLTATVTAPLVAFAAAGVAAFADLDTSMRNIQSITTDTDEAIAGLTDEMIELSRNSDITVDSAKNLAEGYYQIVSSGIDAADAMNVLEASTMAATAGLTETSVAAEAIVGTLNSYGMEAENAGKVSDVLFEVVNRGVGSFEELAGSLSNVTGLASTLNVPIEEVGAAIATMSKQGISFSEATVAMNQAMSNLLNPTRDGAAIIAAMGYESGEAMVKALGFAGSIAAIEEHTGGSATEMGKLFSNTRSLRAALALTGDGAQMFADDLDAMNNASGATAAAFAEQSKAFSFQWQAFKNDFMALAMEVGAILMPFLAKLLEFGSKLINWFLELDGGTKTAIVAVGALVAAIGPLLIIFGTLMGAIASISAGLAALGGAAGIGAFLTAAAPVAAVAAAIVAIGIAAKMAWPLVKQLGEIMKEVGKGVGDGMKQSASTWKTNLSMLGEIVQLGTQKIIGFLTELHKKIAEAGGLGQVMMNVGKAIVQGLISGISSMISSLVNKVKEMASKAANSVKSAFGIASPSKLMMRYGENVVAGFNKGIDSFGGIGVQTPALAPAGASTSPSVAPAFGGGMGGGVTIVIQNLNVPLAQNKEQIRYIADELGKEVKRRGGIG